MKNFLFAVSIGFMSIAVLSNRVDAQKSVSPVAFINTKTFHSSIRYVDALEKPASVKSYVPYANDFNTKAVKDFQARFNQVENAKWFADSNGFISYFVQDGYVSRVLYDRKGRWRYSLILYNEDKLPRDIRASIKSKYFDMAITVVKEVQTVAGMAYIVNLEDKSNIKILRVSNEGEIEILEEMMKD
jgi:hypothetical protein